MCVVAFKVVGVAWHVCGNHDLMEAFDRTAQNCVGLIKMGLMFNLVASIVVFVIVVPIVVGSPSLMGPS